VGDNEDCHFGVTPCDIVEACHHFWSACSTTQCRYSK